MRNTLIQGTMAVSNAAVKHLATAILKVALGGVLVVAGTHRAAAGPLPMPLEAQLDMATHVVVGQITQVQATDVALKGQTRWGRATVAVKEVLKGLPGQAVTFLVATDVPNSNQMAQPPRIHRVGESGIWLIMGDKVSHSFGLLPVERSEEIRRMLKSLKERKWSEPVDGLRAWATVVRPEWHANPVIIFAVKNDSDADILVPSELHHGFITATVTSRDGQVSRYVLAATAVRSKGPFCKRLPPGNILYLHPDYSFIDLAWRQKVSPGKYSVVVACKNTQEDGETKGRPGEPVPCTAWKGELNAPPVDIVLTAGRTRE